MDGRDDVALTNLDQPLFDDARATKRDLVEYFEAVSEQLLGRAARSAAVGGAGAARSEAVHAEERSEVRAAVGQDRDHLGGALEARRCLRALQRPADAAVVREPARDRVPPDAGAR